MKIHLDLGAPKHCLLSHSVSDTHRLRTPLAVSSFQMRSVGRTMMKSLSIKSAVAKLSFHIHDGCLRQAEVLNKVV